MNVAERRVEAVATNLANIEVPGYKRRQAAVGAFDAVLRGRIERQVAARTAIDFTQGPLQATGQEYDLALRGEGFLAVETPSGEGYSRGGTLRLDEAGVLQTLEGFPVAWEGPRGAIDPVGESVRIDPEAQVWQGESRVGQLRLVGFADPQDLVPDRHGYLHPRRTQRTVPHQAEVVQGHLERSNVSAVDEMVALIVAQRGFENGARLLSTIEQSYRRITAR